MARIRDLIIVNLNITIETFLKECLIALIEKGEGFSSKRPLGDSIWYFNLKETLIYYNIIDHEATNDQVDEILVQCIKDIFNG